MYINPSPSDQIWLGQADAPADAADADAPADPAEADAADAAPPVPPECFPGGVPSPWRVKDVGPATAEQLRMGLAWDGLGAKSKL